MSTTAKPTLADLVGAPVVKPVGNVQLPIKPLGWYESIEVIDAIAHALGNMPDLPASTDDVQSALAGPQLQEWLAWVSQYRDDIVHFCELATGESPDTIRAIGPVEMLQLVFAILEVNADFFVRNLGAAKAQVRDRINGLADKLKNAFNAAGSTTTSSASSSTGTASPT